MPKFPSEMRNYVNNQYTSLIYRYSSETTKRLIAKSCLQQHIFLIYRLVFANYKEIEAPSVPKFSSYKPALATNTCKILTLFDIFHLMVHTWPFYCSRNLRQTFCSSWPQLLSFQSGF